MFLVIFKKILVPYSKFYTQLHQNEISVYFFMVYWYSNIKILFFSTAEYKKIYNTFLINDLRKWLFIEGCKPMFINSEKKLKCSTMDISEISALLFRWD